MDITALIKEVTTYVHDLTNGNEFATGMLLTGISSVVIYQAKNLPRIFYRLLLKHFTTTLDVKDSHKSYYSITALFNKDGIDLVNKARTISIVNGYFGVGTHLKAFGNTKQIVYLRGNLVLLTASEEKLTSEIIKTLSLTVLGRSHKFFDKLIEDISDEKNIPSDSIELYKQDKGDLMYLNLIKKRTFDSLYIEEDVKKTIIDGLDNFLKSEQRYTDLGIPYHYGILLYGPPGTGKTSLARVIATYLDKHLTIINDVYELTKCKDTDGVLLLEEIDTLGTGKRDLKNKDNTDNDVFNYNNYSLSNLLKSLDGVESPHGRIVIMTTNDIDALDDAVLRKGRVDLPVEIGYMTIEPFRRMLVRFTEEEVNLTNRVLNEEVKPNDVQDALLNYDLDKVINMFTKEK